MHTHDNPCRNSRKRLKFYLNVVLAIFAIRFFSSFLRVCDFGLSSAPDEANERFVPMTVATLLMAI